MRAREDLRRELAAGLSLNDIRRRYKQPTVPGDDVSPAIKLFGSAPPVQPQQPMSAAPGKSQAQPTPAPPRVVLPPVDSPRTNLMPGSSLSRNAWDLRKLLPSGDGVHHDGTAAAAQAPSPAVAPLRKLASRDAPSGLVSRMLYTGIGGSPGFSLLVELYDPAPQDKRKGAKKVPTGQRMIVLTADSTSGLVLHWGCSRSDPHEWVLPPKPMWPEGSVPNGALESSPVAVTMLNKTDAAPVAAPVAQPLANACDTAFPEADIDLDGESGETARLQRLCIPLLPTGKTVHGIQFVLRTADGNAWYKRPGRGGGGNFTASFLLAAQEAQTQQNGGGRDDSPAAAAAQLSAAAGEIVEAEASDNWWSLMHRYNLANDLLRRVLDGPPDAAALQLHHMLVWLRYSAQRHLTWQRNYNVKPRELAGAQQALTLSLAAGCASHPQHAQLLRSMLSTMGRGGDGGDGQRIRDEILNIMHRHGIKEAAGTWMEEWHQKLHNNTTPDDIPICNAYLAFLRSGGDVGTYWRVLNAEGVTAERLASFERPIRKEPTWPGDGTASALVPDFENYLRILKSVHAGADLDQSVRALGGRMSPVLGRTVDAARRGSDAAFVAEAAAEARQELRATLLASRDACDDGTRREALYLDAALEDAARRAIERAPGTINDLAGLMRLVGWAAEHAALSAAGSPQAAQYVFALLQWRRMQQQAGSVTGREATQAWALRAQAAADRFRAALAADADAAMAAMQPFARLLGDSCGVPAHAVDLFSEEVIRGGPGFALSLALSRLDPALRGAADLGPWAVISAVSCCGRLVVVHDLAGVQSNVFTEPTLLLADRVGGGEELPTGCVGLVTPSTVDVLSHAAVRARNAHASFISCYDATTLNQLRALHGQPVALTVKGARAVTFAAATEAAMKAAAAAAHGSPSGSNGNGVMSGLMSSGGAKPRALPGVRFCGNWAIPLTQFQAGLVGGKSKNTRALRERLAAGSLPPEVGLPASVAVPYGAFEAALDDGINKEVQAALAAAVKAINVSNQTSAEATLATCRAAALQIRCPQGLRSALTQQLQAAGMPVPSDDAAFTASFAALRAVWASKWNLRAYLSLRDNAIAHESLRMSVLVQRVVGARYAFVLHTVDPTAEDAEQAAAHLYGEVVVGLGETLVGNYPGRALAFTCAKQPANGQALAPRVLGFPSKLVALRSDATLIFRSDSNGEDLEGYAGAGLYDSILVSEPVEEAVDYSADPLVWDDAFRTAMLARITEAGIAVEKALGSAQDIEGCVDAAGKVHLVQTRPQV